MQAFIVGKGINARCSLWMHLRFSLGKQFREAVYASLCLYFSLCLGLPSVYTDILVYSGFMAEFRLQFRLQFRVEFRPRPSFRL